MLSNVKIRTKTGKWKIGGVGVLSVVYFCRVSSWKVTLTTSSPFFHDSPRFWDINEI